MLLTVDEFLCRMKDRYHELFFQHALHEIIDENPPSDKVTWMFAYNVNEDKFGFEKVTPKQMENIDHAPGIYFVPAMDLLQKYIQ